MLKSFIERNFFLSLCNGVDIRFHNAWYGIHWYWQSYPLFDIINNHRKCNTIHEYGFIIFGLLVYFKIDI